MAKLNWQAVVAGVGGQGVLFVTKLLAQTATDQGADILISEVHGMAQRGGSVLSHLKAGKHSSPLVAQGQADLLLSLDAGEAIRNLGFVRPQGKIVVNAASGDFLSAQARKALAANKVELIWVDAAGEAERAGIITGSNVVLLAAAARAGALPFDNRQIEAVLMEMTPAARVKSNQKLFAAGVAAGGA